MNQVVHQAGAYSGFCDMKRLGVWRFCTAAMLHGRNNENILHKKEHFYPQEKESVVPFTVKT